jgi:chemotaxis protein histidine kinase CheA
MGSAASAIAGTLLVIGDVVIRLIDVFRSHSIGSNPTIDAIEEEARRQAQVDDAKRAQEQAERLVKDKEEEIKRAYEETEKVRKVQKEAEAAAAKEAQEAREALERAAAETVRKAREAQENAERVANSKEEEMKRAYEETAKARKAQREAEATAEEEARKAREAKENAERKAKDKEEEANQANAARKVAERKWRAGIQPEVWPTEEELKKAKKLLQHTDGALHFAIAGAAGSGKSSLINAFCGLRNSDFTAAPTGVVETTSKIARYPDPIPENPFVWYDVPGAGTLKIPDWEYFNAQGLYIFDGIIVLFDNRFTTIDVAILKHCARFKIPTYIVRSKSNQHIQNMVQDMYDSDSDDEVGNRDKSRDKFAMARDKYITETRRSVEVNLDTAKLPQQRVYIVSKDNLLSFVKRKMPKEPIDELELLKDLLSDALARRGVTKKSV